MLYISQHLRLWRAFFGQLPYFMNELSLTELDMGCSMPQITSTSRPEVNQRG